MPYFVDPTTQGTGFAGIYYQEGFQSEIKNLSRAGASLIFQGTKLPQPIGGMVQIEDVHSSRLFYSYMTQPSDVDIILAHAKTGTYYWPDFQRQIVNPGHAKANVRLWEPQSPRLVGGTAEVKEDIRSSLFYSYTPLPADMDVVLAHAETGTYYWPDFQRQIVNPSHIEVNAILSEPQSPQLIGGATQSEEDIRGLYLFSSHIVLPSDVGVSVGHAKTGTAITDFTQLRKYQVEKQKREISERFDVIAQREDNWDGYGSKKPTELTLDHAKRLMDELFNTVFIKHPWLTPFISSNEDGYITAEWYEEERELHIQIKEIEAEYLQVWGINIHTEMHEDFLSREDYLKLWEWLLHGQK